MRDKIIVRQLKIVSRLSSFFLSIMICASLSSEAFCFEHPRYDIKGTIDARQKKIFATQTVTFTNNTSKPVEEIYFHVYPNRKYTKKEISFLLSYAGYFKINPYPEGFKQGSLKVQSVSINQEQLSFFVEGEDQTLLKVPLNQKLQSGKDITIKLDFSVNIPHAYGRFGWHKNIIALSRWYPILSVLEEGGWDKHPFYPFHRPFFSDAAYYFLDLTVPEDYTVIHSGRLKGDKQKAEGIKNLIIETLSPIREFSLSLSPDYKVYELPFEDVAVKSFYLAGDEQRAKEALKSARDTISYYTKHFGRYPYESFSIAPVYLGYGGEQMSNMIFIDTRVYKLPKLLKRHFDFLISHETGHQWFYNVIGINEFTEMWLEEGVNSYFILEYLEDKYGKGAQVIEWPKYLDWLLPNFSFRGARDYKYKLISRTNLNYPVVNKLSAYKEPSSIFSITYGKGSAIVSMLRFILGEDTFKNVFLRIFKEFSFRNLSTEDFIRICEEESGQKLGWFFNQWLHTTKNCDYAVAGVKNNTVALENRGNIIMPVEIEVEFHDGQKEIILWDGKGKSREIKLNTDKPIYQIRLDPKKELLDIDQTNNVWPRQIKLQVLPVYTPLNDIPLLLPEDSYNLVFGPEIGGSGLGVKASIQKPYDQIFYVASGYEFGEKLHKSRVGWQLQNLFHSQTVLGFELFNTNDLDDDDEDLAGGKVYLRKELWPASYGLGDNNDHITFYLIRNRSLNKGFSLSGLEDDRNISYLKNDEAIVGTILHLGRSGPYPDPSQGYKIDTMLESSGHFLGATQYFHRGAIDVSLYKSVTVKSKLAVRLKYGWGYPNDKNLYELGGIEGLRGYDRKTLRGSNMGLGSIEYRFPLIDDLHVAFLDNIFRLDAVSGVIFADIGQSWFKDIDDTSLRKDAGLGLRFSVSLGSFLEKVLLRVDVAQAISDSDEDPRVWVGVNQAF